MKTTYTTATSKKNFASPKNLRIFAPLKIRSGIETAGSPVSLFYAHTHRKIKPSGSKECVSSNARVVSFWTLATPHRAFFINAKTQK